MLSYRSQVLLRRTQKFCTLARASSELWKLSSESVKHSASFCRYALSFPALLCLDTVHSPRNTHRRQHPWGLMRRPARVTWALGGGYIMEILGNPTRWDIGCLSSARWPWPWRWVFLWPELQVLLGSVPSEKVRARSQVKAVFGPASLSVSAHRVWVPVWVLQGSPSGGGDDHQSSFSSEGKQACVSLSFLKRHRRD